MSAASRGRVGTALAHMESVATAIGVIASAYAIVKNPAATSLDRRVAKAVNAGVGRGLGPTADKVVAASTDLGSVYAIVGSAAVLAATGRREVAGELATGGMIAWTVAQAAKKPVQRPRPYQADGADRLVSEPAGSSWPSGHAAVAGAMAGVVARHAGSGRSAGMRRRVARGFAWYVAASRVAVGVHYPTDVTAGLAIGGLSAGVAGPTHRALRRGVGAVAAARARRARAGLPSGRG